MKNRILIAGLLIFLVNLNTLFGKNTAKQTASFQKLYAPLVQTDGKQSIFDGHSLHGWYENFILSLDWKIAPQANSGILYMVTEEFPASYQSGPEYQLIDDQGYPEKIADWQKTAANYAMDPPMMDATHLAGEWNHTVIKVNKGHVEHWLNGKKVVEYDLWTDTWKQHKANGKWKDTNGYGMSKKGHIALQDHGGEAWFKNISITEF